MKPINSSLSLFNSVGVLDSSILAPSLYGDLPRKLSTSGMIISSQLIDSLSDLAVGYTNAQGLSIQDTFIRRDLGINEQGMIVPFEITTGFIDQIGSALNLYDAFDDRAMFDTAMDRIANNRSVGQSTLTIPEYLREYQLFGSYVSQSGSVMRDVCPDRAVDSDDRIFCYGYPTEQMKVKSNIIPGWQGLTAEDKLAQANYLYDQVNTNADLGNLLSLPITYSVMGSNGGIQQCSYDDLPDGELVFKKIGYKTKGERNTIFMGTSKSARKTYQEAYNSGSMFVQERMKPYVDDGSAFEIKVIQMPNKQGTGFETIGSYLLEDSDPSKNRIVNDGFPQGIALTM